MRSSWRFPLSLQLNCTCFSPGPKKVFLTPSQWQYVKYHLHRTSVLRLACTMFNGTVIYESWPCMSPLCSSQCVSILSPDFHGSFDIKINTNCFIGKPSTKQWTSGEHEITMPSDWGVWAVTSGSFCQKSSGSYLSHFVLMSLSVSANVPSS